MRRRRPFSPGGESEEILNSGGEIEEAGEHQLNSLSDALVIAEPVGEAMI